MAAKKAAKKAPVKKAVTKRVVKRSNGEAGDAQAGVEQQQQHTGLCAELIAAAQFAVEKKDESGNVYPAGFEVKEGEAFASFATRLCEALVRVPDAEYDKVSDAGRAWYDAAVEPINDQQEDRIPALDGFVGPGAPAAGTNSVEQVEAETAAAKTKQKRAAKAKTPAAPKEKKQRAPRTGLLVAELVAKNPRLSFEQLVERIDANTKGIDTSEDGYLYARWQEAKHCVATLQAK